MGILKLLKPQAKQKRSGVGFSTPVRLKSTAKPSRRGGIKPKPSTLAKLKPR